MSRDASGGGGKGKEGEELVWARNELKATLAGLEADLEDLEESVKMVESMDARLFGLTDGEIQERRKYVNRVRAEIKSMRDEVSSDFAKRPSSPSQASSQTLVAPSGRGGGPSSPQPTSPREEDHQEEWAREEQQMMMHQQDRTMDSIAGTLTTLARQAGLMGQEIIEQVEMLDDLESGVDETDSKLGGAMRKMRKFVRQTEQEKSGWCIFILIVVLMMLLLAVILV